MNDELLAILRCPCDPTITLTKRDQGFVCNRCQVLFPIRETIPCFLIDEAILPEGISRPDQLPCRSKNSSSS